MKDPCIDRRLSAWRGAVAFGAAAMALLGLAGCAHTDPEDGPRLAFRTLVRVPYPDATDTQADELGTEVCAVIRTSGKLEATKTLSSIGFNDEAALSLPTLAAAAYCPAYLYAD